MRTLSFSVRDAAIQLAVNMQPFPIKTLAVKVCRRCKTTWCDETVKLEAHDQINLTKVTIAYCPVCADSMAAETDRPTYRREGKRIK